MKKLGNGFLNNKENQAILLISSLYFIITYYISLTLYQNGIYSQLNLIFDSDPPTNLKSLAYGVNEGRVAFSHALLELFSIPIYIVQYIVAAFNPNMNAGLFKELLGIGYSPLFGTLSLIYFYKLLQKLSLSQSQSVLLTLIFAFSCSIFIFSTIPETFIISGFLITLSLYFYVISEQNSKTNIIAWFFLGLLLTGITITNICVFFIIYFFYKKNQNITSFLALRDSVLISLLVIVLVLIYYSLIQFIFFTEISSGDEGKISWITRYIAISFNDIVSNAANVFSAVFNAFFSFPLNIKTIDGCAEQHCNYFTFVRSSKDIIFLLLVCSLIVYFLLKSYKYFFNSGQLWLFLPLALILGYNFVFHTLFGKEMFLYSQHWFVASALLFLLPLKRNTFALISILIVEMFLTALYLSKVHQIYDMKWPFVT